MLLRCEYASSLHPPAHHAAFRTPACLLPVAHLALAIHEHVHNGNCRQGPHQPPLPRHSPWLAVLTWLTLLRRPRKNLGKHRLLTPRIKRQTAIITCLFRTHRPRTYGTGSTSTYAGPVGLTTARQHRSRRLHVPLCRQPPPLAHPHHHRTHAQLCQCILCNWAAGVGCAKSDLDLNQGCEKRDPFPSLTVINLHVHTQQN